MRVCLFYLCHSFDLSLRISRLEHVVGVELSDADICFYPIVTPHFRAQLEQFMMISL